ncbi:MAG: adenylate kinase [Thermomicrobiales bacterium]
MYVILMGAQGSGKGTQAAAIGPELKLVKVATGELFRNAIAEKTDLGLQVEGILARGDLVPDDVTTAIVRERVAGIVAQTVDSENVHGALFDGFPRNKVQAEALDEILGALGVGLTVVVEIDVPREALIERLAGRRTGAVSGRIVNVATMSPDELASIDEGLIQRADDLPEAIARRLALFDEQTAPLLTYYAAKGLLERVNGNQDVDDVCDEIKRAISSRAVAGKVV